MSIFTSNDLKKLAKANFGSFEKADISESIKTSSVFDVFLSHSYLDKQ